jgi:hypothetical protein
MKGNEKDCICHKPKGKHTKNCDAYRLSQVLSKPLSTQEDGLVTGAIETTGEALALLQPIKKQIEVANQKPPSEEFQTFKKEGLETGFTAKQIDFLWNSINEIARTKALSGGFI